MLATMRAAGLIDIALGHPKARRIYVLQTSSLWLAKDARA